MSLLKILGFRFEDDSDHPAGESESVRRIARELQSMDPERARFVAAFAYLLGRVAHADLTVSTEEQETMKNLIRQKGDLPGDQAELIVEIAMRQNELFGHTENFLVSREYARIASREQKLRLLHCLFALSSTDESISMREDREIRQIASEIRLEHRDFIRVRSAYRDHLEFLKEPES